MNKLCDYMAATMRKRPYRVRVANLGAILFQYLQMSLWAGLLSAGISGLWLQPALAATDGVLGSTSTGSVDITFLKTEAVMASSLIDFNLGGWIVGSGDLTTQQNVCVYTSDPAGDYIVTAYTSNGPGLGGEFRMTEGGSNYIHYFVGWTNVGGSNYAGSTATALGPLGGHNTPSDIQFGADTTSTNCSGSPNATLSILVPEAGPFGLAAAPGGTYTDTLTVVVDPN